MAPRKSDDLHLDLYKADIKRALLALHLKHADEESDLRLMQKPTRGVFAGRNHSAGKLKLVPASGMVQLADPGQPAPSGAVSLGECVTHPSKGTQMVGYILRHCQVPDANNPEKGFITPYWWLRSVADEQEANLEVQVHSVSITHAVEINPKPAAKTAKTSSSSSSFVCEVPVLVNKRAMEAGEELLVYKPASPKRPSIVTVLPEAKRAKSSSSK